MSAIILGALTLAAITVITVFGVKNGSPLNVSNATKNSTVIYTTLVEENNVINDVESFKKYALINVKTDDNTQIPADKFTVEMKTVETHTYIDDQTSEDEKNYYFITKISENYNDEQLDSIQNSIYSSINENGIASEKYSVVVSSSKELNYTPDQGSVALATAITIIGASLYVALRFRPSRGIATLVISSGSTAVAYALFVALRVGTSAVTSLAMPLVAVSSIIVSLFYLASEKAMLKEKHGELSFEERKEIMVKSLAKAAAPMLVLILIVVYLAINYFAFGLSETGFLFASALVGEIIAAIGILTIMGPLACLIGKAFNKIKLPKLKMFQHKEKDNVPHKRNSSEPEETIFIGIND